MGAPNYFLCVHATRKTVEDRYKVREGVDELNPEDEEEKAKIDGLFGDWKK